MTTALTAQPPATAFNTASAANRELIIADGLCPQIAELLPGALHELVALGQSQNPLAAISAELEQRRREGRRVQTLHIVAHGSPGALRIGGQWVDAPALIANADQLAQWGLSAISLWSCKLGNLWTNGFERPQ
ncbi:DUF4347 domain-containing protein [Vulcanococcus sp. Clear-D1]|uniref:DUF4347 domain-containing protein n=1 Tax=Vulcanococcus sp. Clear-D1 TaxID=2766970 RepID=UPI0019C606E0|nr:DUF4347 domain-containing protein [Vulcanococcus sp. Clear-D1]MBD1193158.1 DUF4347 domain-containing protein [Vulcanococcus sp. Clear-D1]